MVQVPLSDTIRPCHELIVRPFVEDTCPVGDEAPAATPGVNAKKKDALTTLSSCEEITTLLKLVPCFTTPKPPASNVDEFFIFSRRHFVDLRDDSALLA